MAIDWNDPARAIPNPHGLPTITCLGCGIVTPVARKWSKIRKRCIICQVMNDCSRGLPPAKNCEQCSKTFFPIRTGKSYGRCPDCAIFYSLEKLEKAPVCNVCNKRRPAAEGLDETCLSCICSHEHLRNDYVARLKEIVANRVNYVLETRGKLPTSTKVVL